MILGGNDIVDRRQINQLLYVNAHGIIKGTSYKDHVREGLGVGFWVRLFVRVSLQSSFPRFVSV